LAVEEKRAGDRKAVLRPAAEPGRRPFPLLDRDLLRGDDLRHRLLPALPDESRPAVVRSEQGTVGLVEPEPLGREAETRDRDLAHGPGPDLAVLARQADLEGAELLDRRLASRQH